MKLKFFFLLLLSLYIVNCTFYIEAQATICYVSKTGSSTPPYTSWETAADSIQKCINICVDGDTVYVANGVYYEAIYIDKTINLWGSSMDSTVIDGSVTDSLNVVKFVNNNSLIQNFRIVGPGKNGLTALPADIKVKFCKIIGLYNGVAISTSSIDIDNCIISATENTIFDAGWSNSRQKYINSVFLSKNNFSESIFIDGGYPTILNNIIIEEPSLTSNSTEIGIDAFYFNGLDIRNNLVSGFRQRGISMSNFTGDTAFVINNNAINFMRAGTAAAIGRGTGGTVLIKNNIIQNCLYGISCNEPANIDYILFFNVQNLVRGVATLGDSNIIADPMFVNDTNPDSNFNFDYHLQAYSPAIDKGDPTILDVDGSRSDIGMFGGPYGQKYTYQDLAPKPPRNLTASMDSGLVHLKWNKNTEADLFRYRVYRDTVPEFIYDTTKIIAVIPDTVFYDDPPQKFISGNYYYKITAIDSAYHQSPASEEAHINITGIPEAPPIVVEHYNLLQNYPNPFNPSTTIPYRLKAPGYVKVMVYNLLGEQVKVLVNTYQSAGYYEVLFHPTATERQSAEGKIEFETGYGDIVSGIYLYRIEVIGEGNIPVFTDMKKMMLVK